MKNKAGLIVVRAALFMKTDIRRSPYTTASTVGLILFRHTKGISRPPLAGNGRVRTPDCLFVRRCGGSVLSVNAYLKRKADGHLVEGQVLVGASYGRSEGEKGHGLMTIVHNKKNKGPFLV